MKVGKVLLVEDKTYLQSAIGDILVNHFGEKTEIFVAGTVVKAEVFIRVLTGLDLILMDTKLANDATTYDLTRRIRLQYKLDCPMVAISLQSCNHAEMLRCGCTHAWLKERIREGLIQDFPIQKTT
jgi:response regulator of citrate/malate metabolism